MPLKNISQFDSSNFSYSKVFIYFLAIALFIRFPFFFRDYIDRDESTFILMGQSLVNGHLPYTQLWDLKPPLLFYLFGALIFTFGKSFIALRFTGTLIVAITALYLYKIGDKLSSKRAAFWCGILLILTSSLFGSVQGVMSEHISMFFYIPAMYFIAHYNHKKWATFWAGILLGAAVMIKLNLAYPVLMMGTTLFVLALLKKHYAKAFINAFLLAIGVITTVILTALPYVFTNQFNIWWNSVILAPIAYNPGAIVNHKIYILLSFLPFVILMYFFYKTNLKACKEQRIFYLLIFVSFLGVVFSFIDIGQFNGHYLIQLYPFIILILCIWTSISREELTPKLRLIFFVLLIIIPVESYKEYSILGKRFAEGKSLYNEEGFDVPAYFKENNINPDTILFLNFHIGYWIMDKTPPTKVMTHPSNIFRNSLFPYMGVKSKTTHEELTRIFYNIKPEYIVGPKYEHQFKGKDEDDKADVTYLFEKLKQLYQPVYTTGKAVIYKRIEL
ncbi:ArnT family glycosyltransferase [Zhouia sp. PK063]|uniref:ArnT family glycosyltransferase n=1 Tax=Zhouia sp. PK063 TaxID=3373602 RepID=UPI0037970911